MIDSDLGAARGAPDEVPYLWVHDKTIQQRSGLAAGILGSNRCPEPREPLHQEQLPAGKKRLCSNFAGCMPIAPTERRGFGTTRPGCSHGERAPGLHAWRLPETRSPRAALCLASLVLVPWRSF